MIRSLSYLPGKIERIEVSRSEEDMWVKLEMLRSYQFSCDVENHCGFWLIHWSFPKPTLSVVPKNLQK